MKYKYPKTMHVPFSPGTQSDDRMLSEEQYIEYFSGKEIVITEKMDGENTSIYNNGFHARSLDSRHHYSRNWVKQFAGTFSHMLPDGWRVCGENLYAKHSIFYEKLPTYFMGFSIWNDKNECLSWNSTKDWFSELGITSVPVLYQGPFDIKIIEQYIPKDYTTEGFVLRNANTFHYNDFQQNVAKWVRKGHVQTSEHWMSQEIIPNLLIGNKNV